MADRDEDDFSLRTPSKKRASGASKRPSGKSKRPSGTGKTKRPSGSTKRPSGATKRPSASGKAERPSGKTKRPSTAKAKTLEDFDRPAPAPSGGSKAVPVALGLLLVLGAAGGMFLLTREEPQQTQVAQAPSPKLVPSTTPSPRAIKPSMSLARPLQKQSLGAPQPKASTVDELKPLAEDKEQVPVEDELEAMAAKDADHQRVADILNEFADLFQIDLLANNPHAMAFEERQRREQELLERLRALGPMAVGALQDMILGLHNRAHQIFLAKALAGMDGPEARDAVSAILGQNKDVALQTTLVRFLPEDDPSSVGLLQQAYAQEENPNLRTMLMREVNRRGAENPDSAAFFRQAAANDADVNVRAEAVTILGRRGSPDDQQLMENIIRNDPNLQIRQRAIVAYAETGGQSSLAYLEQLARDTQQGLNVRASAVLAIGRVGGDQAIQALDTLAQSDPDQEIRTRANRLAHSLRARQQAQNEPTVVDDEPMRVGLPADQLDRH